LRLRAPRGGPRRPLGVRLTIETPVGGFRRGCYGREKGLEALHEYAQVKIAFGTALGLDMATMVEVLNGSSGHNTATSDKFPNHVLTGRYASGFANSLMAKDMALYLRAVEEQGGPAALGAVTAAVWERFAAAEPGADFTRIYPYVHDASTP
jgi:hypothetical protein